MSKRATLDAKKWDLEVCEWDILADEALSAGVDRYTCTAIRHYPRIAAMLEWDVKRLSDMRGIVGLHVHTAKADVG